MTRDPHARAGRAIAAHFAATGSPAKEREMRAHLPTCASCRRLYDRHLLLASLDPRRISAEDRLAHGLGFAPVTGGGGQRQLAGFGAGALFLGAVAAAAVLFVAPRPSQRMAPSPSRATDFVARGLPAATPDPELLVYRIAAGSGVAQPAVDRVQAGDELAFAYRNPGGRRFLLIFAIDEHGHIYWYHPEWSRAADNPSGVAISTEATLHELPTAVAHHFDGEELMIHALFTDRELTVRQVEAIYAPAAAGGTAATTARLPGETDIVRRLRVTR